MAKKEIAKKEEAGLATAAPAPAFLQKSKDERVGVDQAAKYQTINRIGIVQPQSGKQRREEFGVNSFVMFPDGIQVAEPGEPFIGIPLFLYPSWEKWSDYNDDESATVIESVLNENHEIARRSKAKATRTEAYGDDNQFNYSYVESINVAILVDSGPAKGEIAIVSFNKSDHYVGRQVSTMISRSDTDIFARRIEFSTVDRTDGKNDWHGFKVNNPTEEQGGTWISEDRVEDLLAMHKEAEGAYNANLIVINRDDDAGGGSGGGGYGDDGGFTGGDDLPPV